MVTVSVSPISNITSTIGAFNQEVNNKRFSSLELDAISEKVSSQAALLQKAYDSLSSQQASVKVGSGYLSHKKLRILTIFACVTGALSVATLVFADVSSSKYRTILFALSTVSTFITTGASIYSNKVMLDSSDKSDLELLYSKWILNAKLFQDFLTRFKAIKAKEEEQQKEEDENEGKQEITRDPSLLSSSKSPSLPMITSLHSKTEAVECLKIYAQLPLEVRSDEALSSIISISIATLPSGDTLKAGLQELRNLAGQVFAGDIESTDQISSTDFQTEEAGQTSREYYQKAWKAFNEQVVNAFELTKLNLSPPSVFTTGEFNLSEGAMKRRSPTTTPVIPTRALEQEGLVA